jgi:hypothetical protein
VVTVGKRYSAEVQESPEGYELTALEGELFETDYSDVFSDNELETQIDLQETIERSLEIIHERVSGEYEQDPFHGLIVVLADVYKSGGSLPLSIPIAQRRLTMESYVTDAESLAEILYEIGKGKDHDGAIIIDSTTGKIIGYHIWLLTFPYKLDGEEPVNNGDGTRKSIAHQYSKWSWVPMAYTMSEADGVIRKYDNGEVTKLSGPYRS